MVRLLCLMRNDEDWIVSLYKAGPGFTLPADIGDLDPAITELDLTYSNLIGVEIEVEFFLFGIVAIILLLLDIW